MGFQSGSITFRRFYVVGNAPAAVDEWMIDKLRRHSIRPSDLGIPEETEYGWSGGRHVLDDSFGFESNVFADSLFLGLRIDTNKVPGDVKKAWTLMEEQAVAAGNPSGFISKAQKRDVKETVRQKIESELRDGKHRKSRAIPLLWHLPSSTLYAAVSGKSLEMLAELFERSFGLALMPLSAGCVAMQSLESAGRRRDYADLRPTRFVHGPEGEGQYPEYPWVAKGPEPKDFLGNEFLLWLWHEADHGSSAIKTEAGDVAIFIDRSLDLDCAFGQTGRDGLRGDGPGRMPEAKDALRSGKVPRKAGMLLNVSKMDFSLILSGESLSVAGLKLPQVEDAETPRVLFEERIALLTEFSKTLDAMFAEFLAVRLSGKWAVTVTDISRWASVKQGGGAV